MEKNVNWGVLGLGRIAHKFVQDLRLLPNARLHAVASTSADRAADFARHYGATHHYGSYEGLLTCPDLDVVYVATPHHRHAEASVLLLRNRIPVLCEKPLAINSRQVEAILSTSQLHQTYLMEALWTRFLPGTQKALELVESGAIGALQTLRADFGFRKPFDPTHRLFDARQGGGSLLDVGIYPLFLASLFLGKPSTVQATARLLPSGVDEACAMLLGYESGAVALLDSAISTQTPCEAYLHGSEGTLKIQARWHEPNAGLVLTRYDEPTPRLFTFARSGFGYHHEAAAVMDDLAAGRTQNELLPQQFSRDLTALLDTVRAQAGIRYEGLD